MKGSYILVLHLDQPVTGLVVGRLGQFDFAAGFYLYVGSAFGSGGLASRLAYHQRVKARPHWHIDYLRAHAALHEIWSVAASARMECRWCQALLVHPAVSAPIPGFGSRDTGCFSHLFYCPHAPPSNLLAGIVLGAITTDQSAEFQIEIQRFDAA